MLVSWTAPVDGGGIDFEVSYSPAEGSCAGVVGGTEVVESDDSRTSYVHVLSNLQTYTEYSIIVTARGANGLSQSSAALTMRTQADSEFIEEKIYMYSM